MPTVHREEGFAFRIFPADHAPPHVHAYKAGHEVKIAIGGEGSPSEILAESAMPVREQVRAVRIVEEQQAFILEAWRRIHG